MVISYSFGAFGLVAGVIAGAELAPNEYNDIGETRFGAIGVLCILVGAAGGTAVGWSFGFWASQPSRITALLFHLPRVLGVGTIVAFAWAVAPAVSPMRDVASTEW